MKIPGGGQQTDGIASDERESFLAPVANWAGPSSSSVKQDLDAQAEVLNDGSSFLATSRAMRSIREQIEKIADYDVPVLILGESGTGKEVVARLLHARSARARQPFLKINCAALPGSLLESELFGYERGAFTGAVRSNPGKFEICKSGTILLDEIGEISPPLQAKLLHVLQDKTVCRLGGSTTVKVEARVIAATNVDICEALESGALRQDLYYRLNVFNIQMPPLREHLMDVSAIAEKMIDDMNERHHCTVAGLKDSLMTRMENYKWPGNVRELRNTIERAVILAGSGMLGEEHLPPHFGEPGFAPPPTRVVSGDGSGSRPSFQSSEVQRYLDESNSVRVEVGTTVDEAERQLILKTLVSTHNNKTKAAEILGISSKTLQNKLKEYSTTAAATE